MNACSFWGHGSWRDSNHLTSACHSQTMLEPVWLLNTSLLALTTYLYLICCFYPPQFINHFLALSSNLNLPKRGKEWKGLQQYMYNEGSIVLFWAKVWFSWCTGAFQLGVMRVGVEVMAVVWGLALEYPRLLHCLVCYCWKATHHIFIFPVGGRSFIHFQCWEEACMMAECTPYTIKLHWFRWLG